MDKDRKAFQDDLEANRARVIPVRNINHRHPKRPQPVLGIAPGGVGLVSKAELVHYRYSLVEITVDGWDAKGFKDGDPIKRVAAAKPADEGEADAA